MNAPATDNQACRVEGSHPAVLRREEPRQSGAIIPTFAKVAAEDAEAWRKPRRHPCRRFGQEEGRIAAHRHCSRTSASRRGRCMSAAAQARAPSDDSARIADIIYRNLADITRISATLDTHVPYQISSDLSGRRRRFFVRGQHHDLRGRSGQGVSTTSRRLRPAHSASTTCGSPRTRGTSALSWRRPASTPSSSGRLIAGWVRKGHAWWALSRKRSSSRNTPAFGCHSLRSRAAIRSPKTTRCFLPRSSWTRTASRAPRRTSTSSRRSWTPTGSSSRAKLRRTA